MWSYNYSDELYHHGIKGQRWGIRRYQNKDGTLTPAGKKRAAKLEADYEKVTGKKMGSSSKPSSTQKKEIKDMSDDEIRTKINRIRLENELKSLTPESKSAGQKFIEGLKNQAISTITDKGTKIAGDYVDKKVRDTLGLNEKDDTAKLKKEAEKLNYKRQIALAKSYLESQQPKKTPTKNLIGNIDDLTDQQLKEMIGRLSDEETLKTKLANRK